MRVELYGCFWNGQLFPRSLFKFAPVETHSARCVSDGYRPIRFRPKWSATTLNANIGRSASWTVAFLTEQPVNFVQFQLDLATQQINFKNLWQNGHFWIYKQILKVNFDDPTWAQKVNSVEMRSSKRFTTRRSRDGATSLAAPVSLSRTHGIPNLFPMKVMHTEMETQKNIRQEKTLMARFGRIERRRRRCRKKGTIFHDKTKKFYSRTLQCQMDKFHISPSSLRLHLYFFRFYFGMQRAWRSTRCRLVTNGPTVCCWTTPRTTASAMITDGSEVLVCSPTASTGLTSSSPTRGEVRFYLFKNKIIF